MGEYKILDILDIQIVNIANPDPVILRDKINIQVSWPRPLNENFDAEYGN